MSLVLGWARARATSSIFRQTVFSRFCNRSSMAWVGEMAVSAGRLGRGGGTSAFFASALSCCIAVANSSGAATGSVVSMISSKKIRDRVHQSVDVMTSRFDVHFEPDLAHRSGGNRSNAGDLDAFR